MNIVGAGTVVNFSTMREEINNIEKVTGESVTNVFIDERAHLIMPYHTLLDGAEESKRSSDQKIGTTKRGIGPCYSDKGASCFSKEIYSLDHSAKTTLNAHCMHIVTIADGMAFCFDSCGSLPIR